MEFQNKEPRSLLQDKTASDTTLEDKDQQPAFASMTPNFQLEMIGGTDKSYPKGHNTGQLLPTENKGIFLKYSFHILNDLGNLQ